MTSDYNNEEIRESSFPADLKNEPDPIDMYGVWVKSGPWDSESVPHSHGNDNEKTDNDTDESPFPLEETFSPESETEEKREDFSNDFPAIDDFDFSASDNNSIEDSNENMSSVTDNILSETDGQNLNKFDGTILDNMSLAEPDLDEDISKDFESDFSGNLSTDDSSFIDIDNINTETEEIQETEKKQEPVIQENQRDTGDIEISLSEFDSPEKKEPVVKKKNESSNPENFEFEDVAFDEIASPSDSLFETNEENLVSAVAEDSDVAGIVFEEIQFSDSDDTGTVEKKETQAQKQTQTFEEKNTLSSNISNIPDVSFDIKNEEADSGIINMVPESETIQPEEETKEDTDGQQIELEEEIDINSFLDDFESPETSGSGITGNSGSENLDLDEFIDSFNESGGMTEKESEKLFDETDPIDLDLDFDEEYIAETEKKRSAGAGSPHSEFFDSNFGVEFVDETSDDSARTTEESGPSFSDTDDFEAMFASIQDESPRNEADSSPSPVLDGFSNKEIKPVSSESSDSYETNEFDDFLTELDNSAPQSVSKTTSDEKNGNEYSLNVTEDISEDSSASSQTQVLEEENFSVSLFDENEKHSFQDQAEENTMDGTSKIISAESQGDVDEIDKILSEVTFDDIQDEKTSSFSVEQGNMEETEGNPLPDTTPMENNTSKDIFTENTAENTTLDNSFTEDITEKTVLQGDETSVSGNQDKKIIDFLPNEGYTDSGDDLNSKDITFDDLEALENDLKSSDLSENLCAGIDENSEEEMNDKSNEILLTIAEELSSIKKEISSLKLGVIQQQEPVSEPSVSQKNTSSGFFSDDDTDETIALTGDELNNILITADFTEENGDTEKESTETEEHEDISGSEPENMKIDDISFVESPITPLDDDAVMEAGLEAAGISDADLPQETPLDELLKDIPDNPIPDDTDNNTVLRQEMDNIEISHITNLEDETGYLSGSDEVEPDFDDVVMEEPGLESIDFEKEQLQEPELADFSMDIGDMPQNPSEKGTEEDFSGLNFDDLTENQPQENTAEELNLVEDGLLDDALSIEKNGKESLIEDAGEIKLDTYDSIQPEPTETMPLPEVEPAATIQESGSKTETASNPINTLPADLKEEIKSVLTYMDQLLENLPEEKIEEFARSEHFEVYKKLFADLGIS